MGKIKPIPCKFFHFCDDFAQLFPKNQNWHWSTTSFSCRYFTILWTLHQSDVLYIIFYGTKYLHFIFCFVKDCGFSLSKSFRHSPSGNNQMIMLPLSHQPAKYHNHSSLSDLFNFLSFWQCWRCRVCRDWPSLISFPTLPSRKNLLLLFYTRTERDVPYTFWKWQLPSRYFLNHCLLLLFFCQNLNPWNSFHRH